MTTIYISRNQYAIRHRKHRFMCCRGGHYWNLMPQEEGYVTVRKFKAADDEVAVMNIDWLNAEDEYFDSVLEDGRVYAIVTLPDGRQIEARCDSTSDGIGWPSYFLPETLRMEWVGGEELTAAEANTDLGSEYLHEYVLDQLAKS